MSRQPDYYRILGVKRNADSRVIRSAYRRLARQYHPDMAQGKRSSAQFLLIKEAYEVLSDPDKRREYDLRTRKLPKTEAAEPAGNRQGFRFDVDMLGIHLGLGALFGDLSPETDSKSKPPRKRRTS